MTRYMSKRMLCDVVKRAITYHHYCLKCECWSEHCGCQHPVLDNHALTVYYPQLVIWTVRLA